MSESYFPLLVCECCGDEADILHTRRLRSARMVTAQHPLDQEDERHALDNQVRGCLSYCSWCILEIAIPGTVLSDPSWVETDEEDADE